MPKVEGVNRVLQELRRRESRARERPSVIVGFTQSYAIFVHENLEAYHKVGQAKFLEQPARELAPELGKIVRTTVQRGGDLEEGLLLAGLRLQREAQERTPVDTGALKASAFTAKE